MKNIKFYIILGLMVISAVVAWRGYFKTYIQQDTVDIHSFPKEIQGWISEDMTLTETEYEILETRNVIARQYTSPEGTTAILLIVYSQNNRKVSHPPEVCYTGSGFEILEISKDFIEPTQFYSEKLEFQKLLLEEKNSRQMAVYWFKVGSQLTPSYWNQQLMIAWHYLTGKPVSSAMVRISSVFSKRGDPEQAENIIKDFAAIITPELFKYLP